eukprot:TRINITY_DN10883_c0_g1_i14.p4 TRINITY_DN10883_c0_g1~~TRINITY_DN10883_c0_g1_i14.p4  ORF type:complete len:185 (-),score=-7.97 TRINITY_DN10883_c0_g1_i14:91-645(-)
MCNYVIIIIIIIIMNQPNRLLWLWRLPVRIHTSDIMQQLYLCNHIINYNSLLFGMYIIQKQYLYNYNIQFTIIYYFICTQCNSCICVIIRYILFIIINYLIYPQYYSCMQIQKKCDYYVIIVECIEQWPDFGCEGIKVQRAHQPTSQCQGKKKKKKDRKGVSVGSQILYVSVLLVILGLNRNKK